MIRITQVKLPVDHTPEALRKKAAKILKINPETISAMQIRKQSLDARKKPELFYSYTLDVETANEKAVVHKAKNPQVLLHQEPSYRFSKSGVEPLVHPPVIIGTGPAGLFCGLMLARNGYKPVLLERGEDMDTRKKKVEHFWKTGELDARSNIQFGEGGAGTFSDGKLNTLVKDPEKRGQLVLEILHEFGAASDVLYQSKPHIGTDVLAGIVKNIREEIRRLGGIIRFGCQATDVRIEDGQLTGVITETGESIETQVVVLAIGHSARDTFEMLFQRGIPMDQKAFAVGLRVQHPQKLINRWQYGQDADGGLGAASYKITRQTSNGRGVYSFCMCPGGYVVNASSEPGKLAVNGMSYHSRSGRNANSALIVTVTPEDFPDDTPLGGVAFQRRLEHLAYNAAGGKIPIQLYGDFKQNRLSTKLGEVQPQMKGAWAFADLRSVMPEVLCHSLLEAMEGFGQVIHGFDREDAVLAGIETRTSSPVRIWRSQLFESQIGGLYPCGEGAGYAGGITSAAMDGIKVAEAVAKRFCPAY